MNSTRAIPKSRWPEDRRHPMLGKKLARAKPIEERFWALVDRRSQDECWPWKGSVNGRGYGALFSHYRYTTDSFYGRVAVPIGAHQLSYRIHKGEVPAGLVVDHICMNRVCVNPSHLRAVTQAVNSTENSNSVPARNRRKTHCKNGHALTPPNIAIEIDGNRRSRHCLACTPSVRKLFTA